MLTAAVRDDTDAMLPDSKRVTVTLTGEAYNILSAEDKLHRAKGHRRSWGDLISTAVIKTYGKNHPERASPTTRVKLKPLE